MNPILDARTDRCRAGAAALLLFSCQIAWCQETGLPLDADAPAEWFDEDSFAPPVELGEPLDADDDLLVDDLDVEPQDIGPPLDADSE